MLPLEKPFYCDAAFDSLEKVKTYNAADTNELVPEELATQWDAMNSIYNEYAADIVAGKKPVDAFDEFVRKWNEAGGDQYGAYLAGAMQP